jgi:hypothetical protein
MENFKKKIKLKRKEGINKKNKEIKNGGSFS